VKTSNLFLLVALVAVFAGGGFYLGQFMDEILGIGELGAVVETVTLASLVFALYKIIAHNAQAIIDFLRDTERKKVFRVLTEIMVVSTAVGIVHVSPETEPVRPLLAVSTVIADEAPEPQVISDRIVVPFFPGDVTGCDPASGFGGGEKLHDAFREPLEDLACALSTCSVGAEVEVDVLGFASSREFKGCENSNALNLELAEKRRGSVIEVLRNSRASKLCPEGTEMGRFAIVQEQSESRWTDYDEMRSRVGYSDGSQRSREVLTRRVDIYVNKKGLCSE
jgi:hypothetical protein